MMIENSIKELKNIELEFEKDGQYYSLEVINYKEILTKATLLIPIYEVNHLLENLVSNNKEYHGSVNFYQISESGTRFYSSTLILKNLESKPKEHYSWLNITLGGDYDEMKHIVLFESYTKT